MSTICALSTPRGVGGVAVIRVSGEDAVTICSKLIQPAGNKTLGQLPANYACFSRCMDGEKILDEVMVTCFYAPRSFTGENTVEISCHGGIYISQRLLYLLLQAGCKPAAAGEFTKRAFLNGKLDLTQAEAVIDLIHARSALQAGSALGQLDGRLKHKVEDLRSRLMEIGTEIMAYVDYPEETIGEIDEISILERLKNIGADLTHLLASFETGQLIREGIPTAIIGRPNVGKSTLMNALLGKDKSIVTDIAGTTRDTVEESAVVGDMVLHLIDTAGIRDTEDKVEAIGVERAKKAAQNAALILAVADGSGPLTDEDREIFALCGDKPAILILNKADLACGEHKELPFDFIISLSAKEEQGMETLHQTVRQIFLNEQIDPEDGILTNLRQKDAVLTALDAVGRCVSAMESGLTADLVGLDVSDAAEALGELTGQSVKEEMIADIFKRFCVGK